MDFLEKLKAMLMGSQQPPAPQEPMMEGKPWEDPSLAPPPLQPAPSASPTPPVMSPMEDAIQQAMKLEKQRNIAKRMIPEQIWNK